MSELFVKTLRLDFRAFKNSFKVDYFKGRFLLSYLIYSVHLSSYFTNCDILRLTKYADYYTYLNTFPG